MGSLNVGNRQGLYNHQQLFHRCGAPWRRRWSWVWKVSSAEAVLVGGWQPRTVCLPHRLQWQTQSFVSREESSCRRYAYTVTPKEILRHTDIQSKTYCSKIYCMWLEASQDTLDPNACLQEYNCKTHAGGVDVGSCYLQVIMVGAGEEHRLISLLPSSFWSKEKIELFEILWILLEDGVFVTQGYEFYS